MAQQSSSYGLGTIRPLLWIKKNIALLVFSFDFTQPSPAHFLSVMSAADKESQIRFLCVYLKL